MASGPEHLIYVVDDDDVVRDSLKALLQVRRYAVRDFGSGEQFLAADPDLSRCCLILDVHMPPQIDHRTRRFEKASHFSMPRLQIPLIMAAIAVTGLILSYVAYRETSGNWRWPMLGLGLTVMLLAAFAWLQRQMTMVARQNAAAPSREPGSEIAGRKQPEAGEQQAAERFRALIDSAHDAIIAITPEGRIEVFNRAAERIFGYRAVEVTCNP